VPVSVSAVDITWEMEDASGAQMMWLEKSLDGVSYDFLSEPMQVAQGNKQKHRYTDDHLSEGRQYYRLAIRQVDGQVVYSKSLAYEASNARWSVTLGPVPANESFTLSVKGISSTTKVDWTALAMDGSKVRVGTLLGDGQEAISVQDWPAGCYWIRVSALGETQTLKCVVLH
jgi:hypothetical protein